MSELTWDAVPTLQRPIVVVAFRGLFDAATSATAAIAWLRDRYESERIAVIDPECYFDFQQERPVVRIDDDGHRSLEWPSNDFFVVHTTAIAGPLEEHPRDLIVCGGVEPHLRWRSFCDHLLDIARTTRRRDGRDARRDGRHQSAQLARFRSPVAPRARRWRRGSGSAARPIKARPGSSARCTTRSTAPVSLSSRCGCRCPTTSPRRRIPKRRGRCSSDSKTSPACAPVSPGSTARRANGSNGSNDAANEDDEVSTYVRKLERGYDDAEPLPSGEDIASELEAFLREQRDGD